MSYYLGKVKVFRNTSCSFSRVCGGAKVNWKELWTSKASEKKEKSGKRKKCGKIKGERKKRNKSQE